MDLCGGCRGLPIFYRSMMAAGPTFALSPSFLAITRRDPDASFCIAGVPFDLGTTNRSGARFGPAVFFGIAALVIAALAWVPVVGYLEALVVPALAARLRRRAPERYAGLRSLARD